MKTGTYGWKSVFAFTFRQTAKSKAFKVSSVIIIVLVFAIALLAGVLPALIGSRSTSDDGDITGDGEALVGTVYFADTTGITTGKDYEGFLSGLGVKINDCVLGFFIRFSCKSWAATKPGKKISFSFLIIGKNLDIV